MKKVDIDGAIFIIERQIPTIISGMADLIRPIPKDIIQKYYDSYQPRVYIRTYQYLRLPKTRTEGTTIYMETLPEWIIPMPWHKPLPAYSNRSGKNMAVKVLTWLEQKNGHIKNTREQIKKYAKKRDKFGQLILEIVRNAGIECR